MRFSTFTAQGLYACQLRNDMIVTLAHFLQQQKFSKNQQNRTRLYSERNGFANVYLLQHSRKPCSRIQLRLGSCEACKQSAFDCRNSQTSATTAHAYTAHTRLQQNELKGLLLRMSCRYTLRRVEYHICHRFPQTCL